MKSGMLGQGMIPPGLGKTAKPITEYTSIQNLRVLNSEDYLEWTDKLTNKLAQVRLGYGEALKLWKRARQGRLEG